MGLLRAIVAPLVCRRAGHDWMRSLTHPGTRRCRRCRTRQRIVAPPMDTVAFYVGDVLVRRTTIGRN